MKVRWSRRALSDLDNLVRYIAENSLEAALSVDGQIVDAADRLEHMPERGRLGELAGTRELVLAGTPYILVYEIDDRFVEILRVRHAAQNWPPKET